ncbi:MAG TPA: tryptophan--tRNA ligase [Candidatus Acidoferrales bacterium]|nr:tryptophan--tRNA ligase [Candidatus Acidoferrales bacterium]
MTDQPEKTQPRVLSGMRPTGRLHLGNYVGALQNWVKLQHTHKCFFFIADWHALTTDYEDTSRVGDSTVEVLLDWLGAGLDPEKCTMFVQSHVREHAELHVLFSMVTPLSWLERVPSYKDQQRELANKDLHTYGFLGYPLLQAADILIYQADYVPVGEDQVAHVELTREVARRFNQFYSRGPKPLLKEPDVLLTKTPKLLGMDKRKMSKSYGNSILLSEEADTLAEKINNSVTDRPKLTDQGSPDRCPVGNLHQIFSPPDRLAYITKGCTQAGITCVECKALAVESTEAHLRPIRERRKQFATKPELLRKVIENGDRQAREAAEATMHAVREAIGLFSLEKVEEHISLKGASARLRVPEAVSSAADEKERREIVTSDWVDRVSKMNPLRKDRPQVFITRKGRKVGIQTAKAGEKFSFPDRPLNVLVLLAEENGILRDYVLPPKIVQDHWKSFARDNSNVLIELKQTPAGATLATGSGDLSIQQYEGDYSALQ